MDFDFVIRALYFFFKKTSLVAQTQPSTLSGQGSRAQGSLSMFPCNHHISARKQGRGCVTLHGAGAMDRPCEGIRAIATGIYWTYTGVHGSIQTNEANNQGYLQAMIGR